MRVENGRFSWSSRDVTWCIFTGSQVNFSTSNYHLLWSGNRCQIKLPLNFQTTLPRYRGILSKKQLTPFTFSTNAFWSLPGSAVNSLCRRETARRLTKKYSFEWTNQHLRWRRSVELWRTIVNNRSETASESILILYATETSCGAVGTVRGNRIEEAILVGNVSIGWLLFGPPSA